jgi:hypothetical protein
MSDDGLPEAARRLLQAWGCTEADLAKALRPSTVTWQELMQGAVTWSMSEAARGYADQLRKAPEELTDDEYREAQHIAALYQLGKRFPSPPIPPLTRV